MATGTLLEAAHRLIAGGKTQRAVEVLAAAVSHDQDDAEGHSLLGIALSMNGQDEQAAEHFCRAVLLDNSRAPDWFRLGMAQERLGRVLDAHASYERATGIDPTHQYAIAGFHRTAPPAPPAVRLMPCVACGNQISTLAQACPRCGNPGHAAVVVGLNSSGQRSSVPPEVASMGWNWGAFCLPWIWMGFHGMGGWAILFVAFGIMQGWAEIQGAWVVCPLLMVATYAASAAVHICLGVRGHAYAWRSRHFEDVEHLREVERRWAGWGVGYLLTVIMLAASLALWLAHLAHMTLADIRSPDPVTPGLVAHAPDVPRVAPSKERIQSQQEYDAAKAAENRGDLKAALDHYHNVTGGDPSAPWYIESLDKELQLNAKVNPSPLGS